MCWNMELSKLLVVLVLAHLANSAELDQPIRTSDAAFTSKGRVSGDCALAMSIWDIQYWHLLLTAAFSAKKHNPDLPILLLYFEGKVPNAAVHNLTSSGLVDRAWPVPDVSSPAKVRQNFRHNYAKLHIFRLTEFKRVLFVDADCLVMGSLQDMCAVSPVGVAHMWCPC